MDYFINQWASLGSFAKQVVILCGLINFLLFFALTKILGEYDQYKYGPDDDDDVDDDNEYGE
tara:strand:+ start:30 stop:215 length:186 start_codon:yes stop_codon:yes gene_type:complete